MPSLLCLLCSQAYSFSGLLLYFLIYEARSPCLFQVLSVWEYIPQRWQRVLLLHRVLLLGLVFCLEHTCEAYKDGIRPVNLDTGALVASPLHWGMRVLIVLIVLLLRCALLSTG